MDKSLGSLLMIEGKALNRPQLDVFLEDGGLREYAEAIKYYETMLAVVTFYKLGRKFRTVVNGANVNAVSKSLFCEFVKHTRVQIQRLRGPSVVKALIMHNTASALAPINGNMPDEQKGFNEAAYSMLLDLNLSSNGELSRTNRDWRVVYAKVGVGFFESGTTPFHESGYRGLIDIMEEDVNKDAAGRRLFLAQWLASQGRIPEAITVLEPVELPEYVSAPNQINEACCYLLELRLRLDIAG